MSELSRTSALASRHTALGSGLEDWNGMGTAWSYNSDPNDEHDAVRDAVGLFDMSPLKKVLVRGADALAVENHTFTRELSTMAIGESAYGSVLTDSGTVCDDAIVARLGEQEWLHCHGSGESMERLQESAQGKDVDIELDDDMHDIAVQGPKSLELLNAHASIDVASLGYFQHAPAELFGHRCRISRTGYSGERGYEVFASAGAAGDIWDQLLGQGESMGIMPCSFTALDKVRIEAALLFFGYDMTSEHTPWEVGLGFTINQGGSDYRGKAAALASRGKERFKGAGISIDHNDAVAGGEIIRLDGEDVGVVNSPGYSHRLNKSLALVHLRPDACQPGTQLQIVSDDIDTTAVVEQTPFYDPDKSRTHA